MRKFLIFGITVALVLLIVYVFSINNIVQESDTWKSSGPFGINKDEYMLGEKIFINISELKPGDVGNMVFLRQQNQTHSYIYTMIPFDAQKKSSFSTYIEPSLSKSEQICTIDDLVGDWTILFRGTNYSSLEFVITKDLVPGSKEYFEPAC